MSGMDLTRVSAPGQLIGSLDSLRSAVSVLAAGADLSLVAGVVSRLCLAERYWFGVVLGGCPLGPVDLGVLSLDGLLVAYAAECERGRGVVARLDLDTEVPFLVGGLVSVRWVVLRMVYVTGRGLGRLASGSPGVL
jgi:Protein of unknown function (DUF664)